MKYELSPEVNPADFHLRMHSVVRLWQQRDLVTAARELNQIARLDRKSWGIETFGENDWLLSIDLLACNGLYSHSKKLVQRAIQQGVKNNLLRLIHAWDLAVNRQFFECQAYLKTLQSDLRDEELVISAALDHYNFAFGNWRKSAERSYHEVSESAQESVLAGYILARAASIRSEWDLSVEWGVRVVQRAPHWSRARAVLLDSFLSRGKVVEAGQLLESTPPESVPFFSLCYSRAVFEMVTGDTESTIAEYNRLLDRWPLNSKWRKYAASLLALLHLERGDNDLAAKTLQDNGIRRWKFKRVNDTGNKRYLSLPLISQNHNHCVPTAAAMVANAQGIAADPVQYACAMHSRDGTPLWKMVDHMTSIGFNARCVQANVSAIEKMLDHGVPLIGVLTGVFNNHVDVICGYDSNLQLVHQRDPMHWFGIPIPYASIALKYRESEGLWALIAPENEAAIRAADEHHDAVGYAFVELSRACAKGNLSEASRAYHAIPNDHQLAIGRDNMASGVVLTATEYEQRLNQHIDLDQQLDVSRLRAALSIMNFQNADEILARIEAKRGSLHQNFVDYATALSWVCREQYPVAETVLKALTQRAPYLDFAWSLLSDVSEQLGNENGAISCAEIALDISPEDFATNRRIIELNSVLMTFQERAEHVHRLTEANPDRPRVWPVMEQVYQECDDGLKYEEVVKTCIRFFPRVASYYYRLANWYYQQGRTELAKTILKLGRRRVGLSELPLWNFEQESTADQQSKPANVSTDGLSPVDSNNQTVLPVEAPIGSPTETVNTPDLSVPGADLLSRTKATDVGSLDASPSIAMMAGANEPCTDKATSPTTCDASTATETMSLADISPLETVPVADLIGEISGPLADLPIKDLLETPTVKEMFRREHDLQLAWRQSSEFRSLMLRRVIFAAWDLAENDPAVLNEIRQLLPEYDLPGIRHQYTSSLLESVIPYCRKTTILRELHNWAVQYVPNHADYPYLEFIIAWLLELCQKWNEAESTLQTIVQRYPAFASAWYRLGMIQLRREDRKKAWDAFQKCVQINPGHHGAIEELAGLAAFAKSDSEMHWLEAKCNLYPYCINSHLKVAFKILHKTGDLAQALERIDKVEKYMGRGWTQISKARLLLEDKQFEAAITLIQEKPFKSMHQLAADWVEIDGLVQLQRFDQALARVRDALQHRPRDPDLLDQAIRLLREISPSEAKSFATEQLRTGSIQFIFCYALLQQEQHPTKFAIKFITESESDRQPALVNEFLQALLNAGQPDEVLSFQEWSNREFPALVDTREHYAYRLNLMGKYKAALNVARDLHETFPDDPRWMKLLGICLQDQDIHQSIEVLRKCLEITGDPDTLTRLARAYQLTNDDAKAQESYYKALEMNPFDCLAISNLFYAYGVKTRELFKTGYRTIQSKATGTAQYFLVAMVKLALHHRLQLPVEWLGAAQNRLHNALVDGGFQDEIHRLKLAIAAWLQVRPQDAEKIEWRPNWYFRTRGKYFWPKIGWVPTNESAEIG
ncbi:MAG TPA: tetratricopeptide repeat protein [Pirellulaceae bacterium]|nr:tetratricopeptide repeat protein [Pirellulaceae bacterium]HMO90690.1 tetratricopeptide repeat protein [Pirellulaceae bacterium]HMP67731.1 tetratricopeptide repeat protein [Pirellulaceae bacterium]